MLVAPTVESLWGKEHKQSLVLFQQTKTQLNCVWWLCNLCYTDLLHVVSYQALCIEKTSQNTAYILKLSQHTIIIRGNHYQVETAWNVATLFHWLTRCNAHTEVVVCTIDLHHLASSVTRSGYPGHIQPPLLCLRKFNGWKRYMRCWQTSYRVINNSVLNTISTTCVVQSQV